MSEYKLFVQRIGLLGLTNIFVAISSIIFLPILTKNFSITDYGIWVQITTTIGLIPSLAMLGLPYTMVRFLSAEKDLSNIREGFYSITIVVFISTFIVSSLFLFFSEYIAIFLFNSNVYIAQTLPLIIFFTCLNTFLLNYFRTFQKMKIYSLLLLLQTYLVVFLVSIFLIEGFDINIVLIGLLIPNLFLFVCMLFMIISQIGFKMPKFNNLKKYLEFGIPTIPNNLSYWIVDSSDRYIIAILLNTTFVGYYAPGYTLGNLVTMILAPFALLLPSILPKYQDSDDFNQVQLFLKYSMKYFLLIAIPCVFALSLLSKCILTILTTEIIASNGYLITPFIAVSGLFFGIYGIISNVIILNNKTKIMGIAWIIAAIINLSFNLIIVHYWGIVGAAVATLLAYLIAFGITLYYSIQLFDFDFDFIFLFKSVSSSIVMSCVIVLINPNDVFNLLFTILIATGVYFLLIFLLKGVTKEEIRFMRKVV